MNTTKKARTLFSKTMALVLSIAMIAALLCVMPFGAAAAQANQDVMDAKKGVVQIQVWFVDPLDLTAVYLKSGTGFLINDSTVVTCDHVATGFIDEFYNYWAQMTNEQTGGSRTAEDIKNNLEIRISVYRDVYVRARVRKTSGEMDFAILTLDEKLENRTPLKLRSSSTLVQTEDVYALGFPGDIMDITSVNSYTYDDVFVTDGRVSKVGNMDYAVAHEDPAFGVVGYKYFNNLDVVAHTATIRGGNSGGPLVDEEGYVVGINSHGDETRNLAVSSDQVIEVLDALGISYTAASANSDPDPTEPEATEPKETEVKETEPVETKPVEDDKDDKSGKDDAGEKDEEEKEGFFENTTNIILVAVAAVVLVLVIVIVVVVAGGKKKEEPAPAPVAPPVPPVPDPNIPPMGGFQPVVPGFQPSQRPMTPPATKAEAAGETTVLNQGAGETTVLSKKVSGGKLVRKSNGEVVDINSEHFVIGRERKNVNYCISNNTSISRSHAKILVKNGATYIVDMGTANGTFVNGVKAEPRHEIQLNNGDKIMLADEELEYRA